MLRENDYWASEAHYLCDVCSEAVTNPLCPNCLAVEIEAWLTLYPNLRKELMPRIKAYLNRSNNKAVESTLCIKCGDKRAAICPFCFMLKRESHFDKMSKHFPLTAFHLTRVRVCQRSECRNT